MEHHNADAEWEDDAVLLGRDDVSDFNPDNILPLSAVKIAKIRKWLQPTAYEDEDGEFNKHLTAHLRGTGKWLLDSQEYNRWHEGQENGLLWIRGIPGSGKSVYAATLIHHLRQEENVPVLFFFFRQIIDSNHQPVSALRDWLAQVLPFSPPLQTKLNKYMTADREVKSLSPVELWRDLRTALRHIPKTFVVVDALDEMDRGEEMQSFLESLAELARWRPAHTKVIMTSRPVAYVELALRRANAVDIRLLEKFVDSDIATFVNHKLASSNIDTEHQQLIKATVPGRANGLFLYAKLAMDAFLQPGADIGKVLETLPQDLNVMYNDLLEAHAHRSGMSEDLQLLIMQFVTHATRPLRLREIASMINVTQYPSEKRKLDAMKSLVCTACGPLLEILPDETISVIHHSLTEFLTGVTRDKGNYGYPVFEAASTHSRLAFTCLDYLQSEISKIQDVAVNHNNHDDDYYLYKRERVVHGFLRQDTFARYAGRNWFIHARKAALAGAEQSSLVPLLDGIFDSPKLVDILIASGISETDNPNNTPVYAASILGLSGYVKTLLSRPGTEVNRGSNSTESPLCSAAREGFADIVETLIKAGADMCERDKASYAGYAPLHLAIRFNRVRVIELLLENGADPMIVARPPRSRCTPFTLNCPTAFEMACTEGHLESLQAIIPYIMSGKAISHAFYWTDLVDRTDMSLIALAHPLARVNEKTRQLTPLFRASAKRDPVMVKALLDAGADVSMLYDPMRFSEWDSAESQTVLHAWAAYESQIHAEAHRHHHESKEYDIEATIEVFHLLIKAGADINAQNSRRSTPLHYAQDALAARLLIEAGASVDSINKDGETLLHLTKDRATAQYLLEEANVSPNLIVDSSGQTALHLLAEHGRYKDDTGQDAREPLMIRMIQAGLDVNSRNTSGQTALHIIGYELNDRHGDTKLIRAMLNNGADIESKDDLERTPLFFTIDSKMRSRAYSDNRIRLLESMSLLGASLGARDTSGRTLLHAMVSQNEEGFQWLLKHGADPIVTDNHGNTLFHELLRHLERCRHPLAMCEQLVKLGVNPQQANFAGRTPLHIATITEGAISKSRCDSVFEWLLGVQHDVDAMDKDGITALHLASTFSGYITTRLLESGADPLRETKEGLNGLHLAARAKQANALGAMLETIAARGEGGPIQLSAVTKTAYNGRSPIYYACASGLPESVKILLDAVIIEPASNYQESPLHGVVEFEEELRNWPEEPNRSEIWDHSARQVGSVTLEDEFRLATQPSEERCEHIEEILEMLASRQMISESALNQAIEEATSKKSAYTLISLLRMKDVLGMKTNHIDNQEIASLLQKRGSARQIFEEKLNTRKVLTTQEFEQAMEARFFDVVCDGVSPEGCLQTLKRSGREITLLRYLVAGGCSAILEKIANVECIIMDEDGKWVDPLFSIEPDNIESVLIAACRRTIPNMNVIKLLVEHFGVNINGHEYTEFVTSSSDRDPYGSALHALALGGHWWQISEALPYLIAHGADVNKRDKRGFTPLNALMNLLEESDLAVNRNAVNVLLDHGADVASVDACGLSCLERAMSDIDMFTLLLKHANTLSPRFLSSAIIKGAPDIIKMLLDAGADPNGRITPDVEIIEAGWGLSRGMENFTVLNLRAEEMFPLQLAVTQNLSNPETSGQVKIVELLLEYGADPLAAYQKSTILHQLLHQCAGWGYYRGSLYRVLEKATGLEPNCTDIQGATLFHLACKYEETSNEPSPAEILLSLGADIYAKDSNGCNTLHYIVCGGEDKSTMKLLRHVANSAPELINERNHEGKTPFHWALVPSVTDSEAAYILLDAGADATIADNQGNTPLHILLRCQTFTIDVSTQTIGSAERDLFEMLVTFPGVNINAVNDAGETPIFNYICKRHVSLKGFNRSDTKSEVMDACEAAVLDVFDAAGAEWIVRNKKGESLMHIAVQYTDFQSGYRPRIAKVKYLLSKGVDPMAEDQDYKTALDVAASIGAKDVLKLFAREGQATTDSHDSSYDSSDDSSDDSS